MDNSLSTREYAELHGISTSTVLHWIDAYLIYAEKIGGRYFIPADEPPPPFDDEFREAPEFPEPEPEPLVPDPDRFDDFETDENPERDDDDEETDEEEEEKPEPCEDPDNFDPKNLRKMFSTREEAEDYAGDIPVSTRVFRRCSDFFFQVAVTY